MNIFQLPQNLPDKEIVEAIVADKGILIERIISSGQASPPNFWYDQDRDEWVVVLQGQAKLGWKDGSEQELSPGDWVLIPAHQLHRVVWTSTNPPCLWLTVHGNIS